MIGIFEAMKANGKLYRPRLIFIFNCTLQMRGPSPNMASAGDAIALEELIRTTCLTKRIRPEEFFVDYDKLRSGFVTCKLFHNRISQSKTIFKQASGLIMSWIFDPSECRIIHRAQLISIQVHLYPSKHIKAHGW